MRTDEARLTRQHYEQDGFYICTEPLIPLDLVERAVSGMDAVRAGNYDTGIPPRPSRWNPGDDLYALCKIEKPQIANRAIMELVSHPALGEKAAEVSGARAVQVWWVQLLYKPPSVPGQQPRTNIGWHQDYNYWGAWEEDSELFTAWVALSDVSPEAGPMNFVAGSHRWGLSTESDFYSQEYASLRETIRSAHGQEWREVPAILPPGSASFHQKLTFHGSGPNLSSQPRRSFAVHMRTENSRPKGDLRQGLTAFIDDPAFCPIVFGDAGALL
ncbi:MAG: phytanoyl-CoA dioxygenase family protein [Caldilineaceae bacterium]|nr:phytanoyl-CoA dioxygenase family protein [Caldilineaceae bacterium]